MTDGFDPPEERRILLVASPAKYEELVAKIDPRKVAALTALPVLGPMIGIFSSALRLSAYLAGTWAAVDRMSRTTPEDDRPLLRRLVTRGPIPLPRLSPSEARKRFRFDMGGPDDGAVYVLSPVSPDLYLAPAVANERLAQEKMAAFLRITSALGAKKIAITSAESRERSAKASLKLPKAAAQLGLAARFDAKGTVDRHVLMELDPPRVAPHVPEELAPWLEAEPLLRGLVETRLTGQPTRARVSLDVGEMLDVGADATADLARRGIAVGGPYRRVARTTWVFEIEWWPADDVS